MPVSQNGYSANDVNQTTVYVIGPNKQTVRLRKGPAGELLSLFANLFDRTVQPVFGPILDDWGYAERPIAGTNVLSNHASGTAIDLNALQHVQGKYGTFTASELARLRSLLNSFGGCIRWGGDYTTKVDEMHFEINADEATCSRVLAKLQDTYGGKMELTDKVKLWNGSEITVANLLRDVQGRVADIRKAHYGEPMEKSGDGVDPFGAYIFTDNPGTPNARSIRIRDLFGELRDNVKRHEDRLQNIETLLTAILSKLDAK